MSDQIEDVEIRTQRALTAYNQSDKPNLAKLAREFGITRGRLRSRVAGHQPHTTRIQPNKALNPMQEKALVSWVYALRDSHTLNTPELIERSANRLLKDAGSDRQVGRNWVYRFIKRLPPDIPFVSLKPAEKARLESESEGAPPRIFTPSPPPDISSSATNSPPDTVARVNKLNAKLIKDLENLKNLNQQVKRHIQRSMDANSYLSQQFDLVKESLKKSQFHEEARNEPRNRKSILGASNSVLGPTRANRMITKRRDIDSRKRQRQQAKHAKELDDEA